MCKCQLCCVLFLSLVVVATLAAEPDEGLAARSKWFDFEAFKVAYRKSYSSLAEEMMRRKCFLARAFRAFVSSSKYKLGLSSYYLAVNDMSDWSPKEVVERLHGGAANITIGHQLPSGKASRVGILGEPKVRANATLWRRKRQPGVGWENPGPVEWDNLEQVRESMEAELGELDRLGRFMGRGANKNLLKKMMELMPRQKLPNGDTVFVDHRHSGCITEVRNQGRCGSCYIISILSMLEWMYCMQIERQIEFSEQYPLDCGRPFGLMGCGGGNFEGLTDFIINVGLELREDYPYQAREDSCPYNDQLHPNVVRGSVRMQFRKVYLFKRKMLPVMLTHSVVVGRIIFLPGRIQEYGGGVLTDGYCSNQANGHQILIVGHGYEGRQEYWLIRNSWGHHWGEAGYLKLGKGLAEWCLNDGGFVVATNADGAIDIDIHLNHLNQRQVVTLLMKRDSGSGSDSGDQNA